MNCNWQNSPKFAEQITALVKKHRCYDHPLFSHLSSCQLTIEQAKNFLKNYDAHASLLRRLLLNAASLMPEAAVGYILENVRNEYGNGDYEKNHQNQLKDLASKVGVDLISFDKAPISQGVRLFLQEVGKYYSPEKYENPKGINNLYKPAIIAGAITATELMAIKEFEYMQKAFSNFGQANHIWFDHIAIEAGHTDDSLALAIYFCENHNAYDSVQYGLSGVLAANVFLYDGLLEALNSKSPTKELTLLNS